MAKRTQYNVGTGWRAQNHQSTTSSQDALDGRHAS